MPNRPDISQYLVHFTRDGNPCSTLEANPTMAFASMSALQKIISILNAKKISKSTLPWTGGEAVCFTECPWTSLLAHAEKYSPYGLGFKKSYIYKNDGGPIFYIRPDMWRTEIRTASSLFRAFASPFCPSYADIGHRRRFFHGKVCDYTHEREWRVPHDFEFDISDIAFVIVKTYDDISQFNSSIVNTIGLDNFLSMQNYQAVEGFWPVHK